MDENPCIRCTKPAIFCVGCPHNKVIDEQPKMNHELFICGACKYLIPRIVIVSAVIVIRCPRCGSVDWQEFKPITEQPPDAEEAGG